jgi:hypothetical protein
MLKLTFKRKEERYKTIFGLNFEYNNKALLGETDRFSYFDIRSSTELGWQIKTKR